MKKLGLLLLAISINYGAVAGGGWVKARQTGYYKLGLSYVSSNGYFAGGNVFSPTLDASLTTASFYTEHGLGSGVSFEGYLPFYTRHVVSGTILDEDGLPVPLEDAAGGVGDAIAGLRFQFYKGDALAIAGTFSLGLPFGNSGLGENENLFTGDDEFNQLIRLDASMPFGGKTVGGFATLYGGLNNRSGNFSNEFTYGLQVGLSYAPADIWVIASVDASRANNEVASEFTNGFTSSMSFTNLTVQSSYLLTNKHGVTLSYTASIDGNVLLVAPTVSVGVFIDIK